MKKIRFVNILFVALIALFALGLCVKGGLVHTTDYLHNEKARSVGGPFESSNSTSRYVLTEAIVEHNTFILNKDEAKFASPDVALYNSNFLSIFMPGISLIGVPFYIFGKIVGSPQLFAYLSVTLFGFINMFLIARIAYKLGANSYAALLGGFLFLFGTDALSYSLFYTQHVTSVTFLLISLLSVLGKKTVLKNTLFGLSAGISLLLDIPNIIFLLPVGMYLLSQYINIQKAGDAIRMAFNMKFITILLGLIPFLVVLAWYNLHTTGSYTKIGQTIGQSSYFTVKDTKEKQAVTLPTSQSYMEVVPFKPRVQTNGFYTLLVSNERSWLYYSPIVWLGILGIVQLYRKRQKTAVANVLVGVIGLNILLYSMFDDPWGGWAFGPRYLIPAAAMLCVGLGIAIQAYSRRIWFLMLFTLTALYSITINVLGALTTGAVPPRTEAEHLLAPIPYTYLYNINLAKEDKISSLVYNLFFNNLPGGTYILLVTGILVITGILLYQLATTVKERSEAYEG
jgi:hypothetical protein